MAVTPNRPSIANLNSTSSSQQLSSLELRILGISLATSLAETAMADSALGHSTLTAQDFETKLQFSRLHSLMPGLTSLAQVSL